MRKTLENRLNFVALLPIAGTELAEEGIYTCIYCKK